MDHQVDIVGLGRMGTAFAHGLADAGWQVRGWSPTTRGRAIGGVEIHEGQRPQGFPSAPLVLVTVPDRLIGAVVEAFAAARVLHRGQVIAHASGALGLDPMEPARALGAEVGSLHPLVATSPGTTSVAGAWAAVDGTEAARACLEEAAKALGLRTFHVPAEARARYHGAASLAANGLVSLAGLARDLLLPMGLEEDEALSALLPLLRSAVEGLERGGLPTALTGPVARGDAGVVERHLEALEGTEALSAYRALSLNAVALSRQLGQAEEARLDAIEDILKES